MPHPANKTRAARKNIPMEPKRMYSVGVPSDHGREHRNVISITVADTDITIMHTPNNLFM